MYGGVGNSSWLVGGVGVTRFRPSGHCDVIQLRIVGVCRRVRQLVIHVRMQLKGVVHEVHVLLVCVTIILVVSAVVGFRPMQIEALLLVRGIHVKRVATGGIASPLLLMVQR